MSHHVFFFLNCLLTGIALNRFRRHTSQRNYAVTFVQRDITGDKNKIIAGVRGDVRAYGAYERRRPLGRHLKRAGESRPVNCGPRDRGVRRDRGATWWNNAIGALRGGMPVRRAHLFTICLVRKSWTTQSDKRLTIGTQRWNRCLKNRSREWLGVNVKFYHLRETCA